MKKIICFFIIVVSFGFAQKPMTAEKPAGYHLHDGFFLSMTGGPAFGDIVLEATNAGFKKMEVSGTGFQFDFKIGTILSKGSDVALSFDVIGRIISNPSFKVDGISLTTKDSVTASDALYGVGITKYFMPSNAFVSATIGLGTFTIQQNKTKATSESGIGVHVKAGKEWWVGDDWGIGAAVGVAILSAKDKKDSSMPNYSGTLSTTRFFIEFNSTFN